MQGKLPIRACYTVKSHLTRPQTLTAVKVSKQQLPQPCAFDTPLRARTVPGLFGKAGLDGKPPPFWEATMAWTRATPVLKRKLQELPFSEFAQMSRAKRLKFSQNSADDTLFTQPGSQNAILERNAQIIINYYQGLNAWNSVKTRLMTPYLLSLAHRMPFWRETRR